MNDLNEVMEFKLEEGFIFELKRAISEFPRKRRFYIIEKIDGGFFEDFEDTKSYFTEDYKKAICFNNFNDAMIVSNMIGGRARRIIYKAGGTWALSDWGKNYNPASHRNLKYLVCKRTDGFGKATYELQRTVRYNEEFFTIEVESRKQADEKITALNIKENKRKDI